MRVMNVSQFREDRVVRDSGGQFAQQHRSAPEASLSVAPEPIIINSPAGGSERRANLWIVVPEGQAVEMNVFEAGIGRAEEGWREDSITFRRTPEGVRAVYEVSDDDINAQFEEALAELDPESADELKFALRTAVLLRSRGRADALFSDGGVRFSHVSDHPVDDNGGFFTAQVFDDLEADPSYVITRDGVLFPAAYEALADYGFGD